MLAKSIDVSDADIVSSLLIIRVSIVRPTEGSALIAIPPVDAYGSFMPG
jgi:hypothetical protein